MIVTYLVLLLIVIIAYVLKTDAKNNYKTYNSISKKPSLSTYTNSTKFEYSNIVPYEKGIYEFKVTNIWKENARIQEFKLMGEDIFVKIKFSKAINNAPFINVFSIRGILIGEISNSHRKLVKTLSENPTILAKIIGYNIYDNGYNNNDGYFMNLKLWLGYDIEELEPIKDQILMEVLSFRERSRIQNKKMEVLNQVSQYKDVDNDKCIKLLSSICSEIKEHNQKNEDYKIVSPLDQLIILTNKLERYDKSIEYFDEYIESSFLADKFISSTSKRINFAMLELRKSPKK